MVVATRQQLEHVLLCTVATRRCTRIEGVLEGPCRIQRIRPASEGVRPHWVGQLAGLGRSRLWVAALEDLRHAGFIESAGLILAAGVEEVKHSARFVQKCHFGDAAVKNPEYVLAETIFSRALVAANSGLLITRQRHRRDTEFAICGILQIKGI